MTARAVATMPGVSEFPAIVNLEVFRGRCPCRCIHCPVGLTPVSERRSRFGYAEIELGRFRQIVDEVAEHPESLLRIHSTGEPLLWRQLPQAASYIRERGARSWLFTSAVTRDAAVLRSVMENLSIVEVSVNSTSAREYAATKGVDAFELVTANLEYMRSCARSDGRARLLVSRVESEDPGMDAAFVAHWRASGLVDDAFVRTRHNYNHLLAEGDVGQHGEPVPCLVHWARFNIGLDGAAVVCFNELFKSRLPAGVVLGDVARDTIEGIWGGERMQTLRRANFTGDYGAEEWLGQLPCRSCTELQPVFGVPGRQTSEYQVQQVKVPEGGQAQRGR